MRLQKTLQKFRNQLKTKSRQERPKTKNGRLLRLEQLEDRTTPSILFTPHPAENATNGGGGIIGNSSPGVPIYTIFWGSYWATSAGQTYAAQLENSIDGMFNNTAYLDGLQQYGTSFRAFVGSSGTQEVFETGSDPASGFSQSSFQNIVQDAIDNQGLPEPDTFSNEGIYVVFTTPGIYTSGDLGYHTVDTDFDLLFDLDHIHEAWVGTDGTLDGTTPVFTHEVAETMTDPEGGTWQVDPRSSSSWNEIGDNEAQNYTYRLNGYLVQSLWSQEDAAYEVEDGNAQNFFVNLGQLTINGDQFGAGWNDSITIDQNGSGGVFVNLNGEIASFDPGVINSIVVNTGTGFDTVNINTTISGVPVTINTGGSDTVNVNSTVSGGDVTINENGASATVNITPSSQFLDNIQGNVTVNGPSGVDTLNVFDHNDGFSDTWTVTGSSMTRTASATISYSLQNFININGGTGNLTYNITNTESVFTTTLHTGPGADTVNIQATGSFSALNVIGDGTLFGNTVAVNIGSGGSVQNISGTVNLENPLSFNTITVDDSADGTARTTFLGTFTPSGDTNWGFISGLAPANINYEYEDTTSVTVTTGNVLGNVVDVLATGTTTNVVGNAVNTVNIGSNAPSLGGTLANIAGPLNISNASVIAVDDSGDGSAQTATITNGSISGTWSPAVISYTGASTLSVHAGGGGDTINVQSTSATTNLILAGLTTVNVGNAGSVQGILGTLNIENPPAFNTIVVDDSADPTARTVTLSTLGTNGSDSEGNADPWGQIVGLAPAHINYEYGDTTSLTVNGGTGGNTFNVLATGVQFGPGNQTTTLNTGTGNDTVNVQATSGALSINGVNGTDTVTIGSLAPSLGGTLANIAGAVNVSNSSGHTNLIVDDSGDATARTATITSSSITGLSPAAIGYTGAASGGVSSLTIHGPSAGSTYTINSTASGITTTVDAGAGNDTFDVTAILAGALTVNGGGGSNTLVGPNLNNTWAITSTNGGKLNGNVTFTSVQNLTGGTANDNFVFSNGKGVTGTINGGGGFDTLDYHLYATGVTVNLLAGTATGTGGVVNVHNVIGTAANDTITGDNAGDVITLNGGKDIVTGGTGNDKFILASTQLSGTSVTGAGGTDTLVGANITNTWTVTAAGAGNINTTVTFSGIANLVGGTGADTFKFSGASPSISGTITGGAGVNKLDYSLYTGGPISVNLQTSAASLINGGAAGGFSGISSLVGSPNSGDTLTGANVTNTWTITAANTGTVGTFSFSAIENLVGGTGNDTFKFSGAAASISGNINGGGGLADKLDYSLNGGGAVTVNLQTGKATSIGGTFSNIESLVGSSNTGDTLIGANTTNLWSITGIDVGKVNTFSYSAIEKLVGGTGLDTFKFSLAGKETSIVGGGAPVGQGDWLDYSSLIAPNSVNVNLAAGTTAINGVANASISGIENVIGGAGADTLTGDSNVNGNILIEHGGAGTINGGSHRSLLIGGTGATHINGGSGGDIMIGGKTSYDTTNHAALMVILAEWASADAYTTRTDEITDGAIPLHAGIKLATGVGGTVTLNGSSSTEFLKGKASSTDLDWFWATTSAQHSALETVSGVTELVNNDPA